MRPTIGLNTDDIISNFKKLREYPLHQGKEFLVLMTMVIEILSRTTNKQ